MSKNITPLLEEQQMRDLGFTDHVKESWYYCARVGDGITINVSINKETGHWEEHVLDEDFGQHYFYGGVNTMFAMKVRATVDKQVAHLNSHGLTIAVDHREYGAAA